jgi:hypothetical protein
MKDASPSDSLTRHPSNSLNHRGWSWVALCLAFAVHVFDEAMTDFLSVYNPAAQAIRDRLPFLPLPIFTLEIWLAGLIAAITMLLLISPLSP